MSADVINVQFPALQASSQSLALKAKVLDEYIQQLVQSLQPMKQTWVASGSSAGVAAQDAQTKLQQATEDIITTINQFSQKVTEAHDLQYSLEQRNTGYFA